jgi:hypothetical protein
MRERGSKVEGDSGAEVYVINAEASSLNSSCLMFLEYRKRFPHMLFITLLLLT